ncbi:MAG: thiamine phosphate synthase [Methylococcaceae bacterium]|nr:thiamine phosphate synthase [Methylococcaceae bacterium]
MSTPFPSWGLYAITDSLLWPGSSLVTAVAQAIEGGARAIQYREKHRKPDVLLVKDILHLCRSHQVPLIINDDIDLASRIGADGVHLGRYDRALGEARRIIGDLAIIGISCYDSISRAARAEQEGADYVAFGCFFPSRTKPDAKPVDIGILRRIAVTIPVVAIGGITPEYGKALLESGADLLAVVSGIFGHANPARAAFLYAKLFENRQSAASWNAR